MRKLVIALASLLTLGLILPAATASAAPPTDPPGLFYPPSLTAEQWAAQFPAAAKAANANAGLARAAAAQVPKVLQPMAVTGPKPWAGEMVSSLSADGTVVVGCTWGVSTMTSVGTRYGQTAGHCMKTPDGTGNRLDPNTAKWWTPFEGCPGCRPPNVGDIGWGGATFNGTGDVGWVRANLAGLTFSEVNVYDSRGAVNLVCACDPIVGEAASISLGKSAKLLRGGLILSVNGTQVYQGNPTPIGNQAQFRTDGRNGCVQPGDSGSPVIGPNHEFLGTVSGGQLSGGWCFVGFDQGRKSMQRVNQQLAPSDPSTT